jgi:hypothetical protein
MDMLGFCNSKVIQRFGNNGQIDSCRFLAINMARLTLELGTCSEVIVLLDPHKQCGEYRGNSMVSFVNRVKKAHLDSMNVTIKVPWLYAVTKTAEEISAELSKYPSDQKLLCLWEKVAHEVRHYVQHQVFHGDLRQLFKTRFVRRNQLSAARFSAHADHLGAYRRAAKEADAIYVSTLAAGLLGRTWDGHDIDISAMTRLLMLSAAQGHQQVTDLLRAHEVKKAPLPLIENLPISFAANNEIRVLTFRVQ